MGRKTKDSGVDGLALIDKPAGWTSHDVVARCRGAYGQRRCGHSGTLDPDATGVLLVGFGQVTKLLPLLTALPKTYTTEIVLGSRTSTLDDSGTVTQSCDMRAYDANEVHEAAQGFVGDIEQIPPMVSAVQVDGVRLHELARQGVEVERKPRPVHVHSYVVHTQVAPGVFSATVVCGSGTYIRTLVDDLGVALGGFAHLRNLRRTHTGSFAAADGDSPTREGFGDRELLHPVDALRDYPLCTIEDSLEAKVRNGMVFDASQLPVSETPTRIVSQSGVLLAVYRMVGGKARPEVVLSRS